jgi:serine/threonine-protein kinase
VAEDDRDFRDALEVKLHMEFPDADVVCVGDGNSALRAIDDLEISAAILDLQMPGLGGIPLTAALRARDDLAKIPVFVLTAAGGPNEWRLLHHIGCRQVPRQTRGISTTSCPCCAACFESAALH